jgi:hypothetical protein
MTQEEADKLAKIFRTVDSSCAVCIMDICDEASSADLGFVWRLVEGDSRLGEVIAYIAGTEPPEVLINGTSGYDGEPA